MSFWTSWALWQKLSFALAGLLVLVLAYSACVLAHNRRKINRHAAAEAYQREEDDEDVGVHLVLTGASEVPFGATALERGIQVDGIWSPSNQLPRRSSTASRPGNFGPVLNELHENTIGEVQIPMQTFSRVSCLDQSDTRRISTIHGVNFAVDQMPQVFNPNVDQSTQPQMPGTQGEEQSQSQAESGWRRSRAWLNARSSWITRPLERPKRLTRVDGFSHARTSSEEFRRRISRMVDEGIQVRPAEAFQLRPLPSESSATASHHDSGQRTQLRNSSLVND